MYLWKVAVFDDYIHSQTTRSAWSLRSLAIILVFFSLLPLCLVIKMLSCKFVPACYGLYVYRHLRLTMNVYTYVHEGGREGGRGGREGGRIWL